MGNELRALFKDLFNPSHASQVRHKMAQILATASKIGGLIQKEAEVLHEDIVRYLENPKDQKLAARLKAHALKLEEETREL